MAEISYDGHILVVNIAVNALRLDSKRFGRTML
jgi:hypothetical protein